MQHRGGFSPNRNLNKETYCNKKFRTETEDITLYSNYFEILNLVPNWSLYHYTIDFEPAILSKRLKCGLVHANASLFQNSIAFDGVDAFSIHKLPDEITEHMTKRSSDNEQIKLIVKLIGQVDKKSKDINRVNNIVFKS